MRETWYLVFLNLAMEFFLLAQPVLVGMGSGMLIEGKSYLDYKKDTG